MIPFNKPYLTGKEVDYIKDAVALGQISGNGPYTKKCQYFFEEKFNVKKALLTTSCTDALEMCAILLDISKDDEIIVPSYTFVSSALAFVRQGAKIVFADSETNHPNIDTKKLEALITPKTKAIVVVHYAGMSCDMDAVMELAKKHNIYVVEDAAQAVDSFYKGKQLGTIGHFGCFSFHETKNIQCGEGGLLCVNDAEFIERSEIIWEKGTNRAEFFRGEVNKYGWVDTGSSFLPSELNAAFLYAQLEQLDDIQSRRKFIWDHYYKTLKLLADKGKFKLPEVPDYATNNAHMFYLIFNSNEERSALIKHLKDRGVHSVFHYLSLHKSDFIQNTTNDKSDLPMADIYSDTLLRLPLFYELTQENLNKITSEINSFYV